MVVFLKCPSMKNGVYNALYVILLYGGMKVEI